MSSVYLTSEELVEKYRDRQEAVGKRALREVANEYQQQAMRRRMASQICRTHLAVSSCMNELRDLKMQAGHYLDALNATTASIASLEQKLRILDTDSEMLKKQLYGEEYSSSPNRNATTTGFDKFYSNITHAWRQHEYCKPRSSTVDDYSTTYRPWKETYGRKKQAKGSSSFPDLFFDSPSEEEESRLFAEASTMNRRSLRKLRSVTANKGKNRAPVPVGFDEFDYLDKKKPILPPMDDCTYLSSLRKRDAELTNHSRFLPPQVGTGTVQRPSSNNGDVRQLTEISKQRRNLRSIIDKYNTGCTYSLISVFPPLDRLFQLFVDARPAISAINPSLLFGVTLYKVAVFVGDLLNSDAFYRLITTIEPIDLPPLPESLSDAQFLLEHECMSATDTKEGIYTIKRLMDSLRNYVRAHWFDSVQSSYVTFLHRYYLKFLHINNITRITVPLWSQYKRIRLFNAEKHLLRDGELDFLFLYAILSSFAILHEMKVVPVERATYGYNELKMRKHTIDRDMLAHLSCTTSRYICIWPAWEDKYNNVFIGSRFCKATTP